MLSVFAVAFSNAGNIGQNPDGTGGISWAAFYLPGMVAAGMLLSGVQNLGVDIAGEKGDGTLKRLGGSPLPVISYFIGKIGMVMVSAVLQAILLLVVARFAFNVALPTDADKWLTFAWVFLLGRHHQLRARDSAVGPAPERQERHRRGDPDRAPLAVHLRGLPAVQHAAGVAAERREHLPAEVDGAGHACGVPAGILRHAGADRGLEPRPGWPSSWRSGSSSACCSAPSRSAGSARTPDPADQS